MKINRLMGNDGDSIYYSQRFRRYLETYMPYLRNHVDSEDLVIDHHDLYKFEGDFYGLLSKYNIERKYHWIVLRINDLLNPNEVPQHLEGIKIPNPSQISKIVQIYKTHLKNKRSI